MRRLSALAVPLLLALSAPACAHASPTAPPELKVVPAVLELPPALSAHAAALDVAREFAADRERRVARPTQVADAVVLAEARELAAPTVRMVAFDEPVLAQAAPAPSLLERAGSFLLSEWGLGALLGIVSLVLGRKEVQRRRLALLIKHGFFAVEDWKREFPESTGLEKASQALKFADEYAKSRGWRPLTRAEQDVAKQEFQALHGQAKAAEGALVSAQVAAAQKVASLVAPAVAREVHTPDPLTARAG